MNWLQQLLRRNRMERDLSEEIQQHLNQKIEALMASGMPPDEAARDARRDFGDPSRLEERSREVWQWPIVETLWTDIRQVLRQIRKGPGSASIVILVLAAGFGVSTAIFSAVRGVLLDPLPYEQSERLVQIVTRLPQTGEQSGWSAPFADAIDWRSTVPAFSDVAMYRYALINLTEGASAEALYGLSVTQNLLPMLGVQPQLGHWFSLDDDRPGHTHVMILSDDLWRRRFHGDPGIIGKSVHFDNEGYQVIGVMPPGFNFPLKLATSAQLPSDQMQYWMPLGADLAKEEHGNPNAGVIARLKAGTSLQQAAMQLEAACSQLEREYPTTNQGLSAALSTLRQHTVAQFHGPLLALFAATGLMMLLACANVAGLLLAKGEARKSELAVRMALGGSAWRVARLPLIEGILLCLCGCAAGIPFGIAILKVIIHLAPMDVPRLAQTRIDLVAVGFGVVISLLSGILVGGVNAMQAFKRSPREALADYSKNSAGQPRTRLRSVLVAGQIAFAVVLVSGAGLMLRTFTNLLSTDTGYQPDHVMYGVVVLPPAQYPSRSAIESFYKKVVDRLRVVPGVEYAAASAGFPLVGEYEARETYTAQTVGGGRDQAVISDFNEVSPGYMEAMGIRLIKGRFIGENDNADAQKVVVVDEGLARRLWPGQNQDPLGKLINVDEAAKPVWREVIGVVAQTRNTSLEMTARPGAYAPLAQGTSGVNFVVVKSHAGAEETTRWLRSAVSSVDPNQSVFFVQTMTGLIRDSISTRRFLFVALLFFGASALFLSAFGIYGLVSFIASSRTPEVGVRMALGASRSNIIAMFALQGARLALTGIAVGLLASAAISRLLSGLLFGVRPFDAGTWLLTIALIAAAATLATLVPACRSASIPPMQALRTE